MTEILQKFLIPEAFSVKAAMQRMSDIGQKTLFIVDEAGRLIGALSDGDIRRWILSGESLEKHVAQVGNQAPRAVEGTYRVEDVRKLMLEFLIDAVPVIDVDKKVTNVLTWEEIFSEKSKVKKTALGIPVVIMAGGKGTRLDPFTKILPKPLIPIGEKPVIEIIMDKFREHGVDAFHLSVNHKGRMIKSYFEDMGERYKITYIDEDKPLGTAGSLRFLKDLPYESIFVTNCDSLVESDYGEMVQFHQERGNDITLVVSCRRHVIPYGICEIENGGALRSIKEKPAHDLLVNIGMYVIKTKMLDLIPADTFYDITDLIASAQTSGHRIGVFPISETAWVDIGQWEEYRNAVKNFRIA